jgi:hypothetical protein
MRNNKMKQTKIQKQIESIVTNDRGYLEKNLSDNNTLSRLTYNTPICVYDIITFDDTPKSVDSDVDQKIGYRRDLPIILHFGENIGC